MIDIEEGDLIKIKKDGVEYKGTVMPSIDDTIVLKLENGYNIGINIDEKTFIEIIKSKKEIDSSILDNKNQDLTAKEKGLPNVSVIFTGGTIASRIDYKTGAVTSQFKADEIIKIIPELSDIATIDTDQLFNILSENISPKNWVDIARAVYDKIKKGSYGVVIAHGTDTMNYTASALSFMLRTPIPVVLVGSQRSSDRPSSDSYVNMICATKTATSDIAEVSVVMHGTISDDFCLIHKGTNVRKMHTSRRDAFRSINSVPIGKINYPDLEINLFSDRYKKRDEEDLRLYDKIEEKCALIKFYPGCDPGIIDFFVEEGYKGVVIEGTGLGHVSSAWIPHLKQDIPIVITSQCLNGRVSNRVYDTGRMMIKAGVIDCEDILPETALTKLMWVLGQTKDLEEVKRLMRTNMRGEISKSTGYIF
ncbi:Glu-tRNA(Gln) amidotransferase subunit GatD [Candidatus Methanoliparum sp. LAM-1]|uniref:Glu-tRNA(Gln) amidotransferase subunit GatD n=1 Tax=Candidatus Methanoliparum sp. LAM-1 TaxID=2874846 RepID=UPI001E59A504|nr:Glu-tRNA(Gln) amidotransferase subunit GatD [Candidatus Methanoliparum sp. LAM-1]BDC36434.1 glutamyl-tRNA(Gln) amidotransferase subunit D [Candidatus Methanoliparum sp. LAM-1]